MRPNIVQLISAVVAASLAACAHWPTVRSNTETTYSRHVGSSDRQALWLRLPAKARLEAIRRARVWASVDVAAADLKAGPAGRGAFEPYATVRCDYRDKAMGGKTPKFICAIPPDDELKVKYGQENGEVYAEVAATRLMWALGFPADRMYPVRVECHGCSPDPHASHREARELVVFDPAAVERRMHGHLMESSPDSGWTWAELNQVQEAAGGAPQAQRDALKLLAVFIQHGDNKASQQRLYCASDPPAEGKGDETCAEPWMMMHDVGLTFGHANLFNRDAVGGANFEQWSSVPIWRDGASCVGNLALSQTGSLGDPRIGEAGRKFLADLLVQLSDAQLRDLFEVARFPQRKSDAVRPATTEQWVDAFKKKRDQIVNRACPM